MATLRVGLCLLIVLLFSSATLAQTPSSNPREDIAQPAYTGARYLSDVRPVTNWFLDSTISDGIDVEPYFALFDDTGNGIRTGVRIAA